MMNKVFIGSPLTEFFL